MRDFNDSIDSLLGESRMYFYILNLILFWYGIKIFLVILREYELFSCFFLIEDLRIFGRVFIIMIRNLLNKF